MAKRRSEHEALVRDAIEAIDEVFSDSTVSQTDTIASLKELISECEIKIEAIKGDIERSEQEG